MMAKRTFTDDQLISAVENNITISDVLKDLGLRAAGGNYKSIHNHVKRLNLNIDHWNPYHNCIAVNKKRRKPIEEIMVVDSSYSRSSLKKRLIKEKIIEYKCDKCNIIEWHGERLSLQLDHINGIWDDNRLENLRFLCPNCHSLTKNFAGRSTKKENFCVCGKRILLKSRTCVDCVPKKHKINWPQIEDLINMVNKTSHRAVGNILGVSDNAVRKHIKKYSDMV
jgi:hypothetical protein